MSQWGTSDTGILRKNKPTENLDELLVFGYACKLFRDDEKAQYIDQGKHLIPWMGDDKLKIDRYDCRGALSSLKQYEASREGYDAMRWLGLSDSERKLEELCDKERYYSLEINEEEEEMYKEEEQKRQKTNAFQYSYDVPKDPDIKEEVPTVPEKEEEDEQYTPLPTLDVPVDIEIPQTVKEYARIEKTAMFVCKQGLQMEILIKAKQGDSPNFGFLTQGDKLYKFYRHVLAAFKNGRYQPQYDVKRTEEPQDTPQDQEHSGDYLHPSLTSTTGKSDQVTPTSTIPAIPYRPSANCAYSQLVSRIQGNSHTEHAAAVAPAGGYGLPQNYGQLTAEQQQYYMYYYVQQYYEYYKHMMQSQMHTQGDSAQITKLPDHFQQLDSNMQSYIQQLAFAQYMQQQPQHSSSTSYAQIVSNLNKDGTNPYSANVPQLPPENKETTSHSVANVEKTDGGAEGAHKVTGAAQSSVTANKEPATMKKPLLSLAAAYASGSDSDSEDSSSESEETSQTKTEESEKENREVYRIPAGDTQVVIDKMAVYVSKNGEQFEEIVKAKGDPRFEFLNDGHEFNKYYRAKIRELKGDEVKVAKDLKEVKQEAKLVKKQSKPKKVITPVSFSIKKAKEEQPKEIKSALPIEESDEEIEEPSKPQPNTSTSSTSSNNNNNNNTSINKTTPSNNNNSLNNVINSNKTPPTSVVPAPEPVVASSTSGSVPAGPANSMTDLTETKEESEKSEDASGKINGILDPDDPIFEMMTMTGTDLIKDARRAEDKIKDKLATAAREKLASVARDKALQLERKRKAAAFLKLKSAESASVTAAHVPEKSSSLLQKSPSSSQKSPISQKSPKSESSSSRRSSVEVIFEDKPAVKEEKVKERSRSNEKRKTNKEETCNEKTYNEKDKKRSSSPEEIEERDKEDVKRKKGDRVKSHKKKKSHKRKRSKSRHDSKTRKKKSKKHRKRSNSVSSSDGSVEL